VSFSVAAITRPPTIKGDAYTAASRGAAHARLGSLITGLIGPPPERNELRWYCGQSASAAGDGLGNGAGEAAGEGLRGGAAEVDDEGVQAERTSATAA
jgi:hypothetical protein